MKIELDTHPSNRNIIESYSTAGIIINNVLYENSIIVCPDQPVQDWSPHSLADLDADQFLRIFELAPELILLGTGKRLQFPDQHIFASIMTRQIGIEVMDTAAACRAYNYTAGEGRRVVAAMLSLQS